MVSGSSLPLGSEYEPKAQRLLPARPGPPQSQLSAGLGLGLVTALQFCPSQWASSVWLFPGSPDQPAAQASSTAHAHTPSNMLRPPGPFGLGTTLQAVPFQCSIRVRAPAPRPTAQASSAARASTPV